MTLLLFGGGASGGGGGGGGVGSPIGLLLALTYATGTTPPPPPTSGLPKGGHGRKKYQTLTRSQVETWWDKRDALQRRTERLQREEQREEVEASVEAVSRVLEAPEASGAVQFDAMMAAVGRAIAARKAENVIAEAKGAELAAIAILEAIEDENAAVLLLLS